MTCVEDGTKTAKCDNCDATDTIVDPAGGHSFTNYISNGDATCVEGTGAYKYLDLKTITFTYSVYITDALSDDECMIKVTYDTGDVEDFRFFFNRDTANLCFHNSEGGGYNGVIEYNEWTRK